MITINKLRDRFYIDDHGYLRRAKNGSVVLNNIVYIEDDKLSTKRVVISLKLGYILNKKHQVFHIDGNKLNINSNNLEISSSDSYIYFETKYGTCKLRKDIYKKGDKRPMINRAVNKTEYLKLYLKDVVGEYNYTYNNLVYNGSRNKITITCKKYGDFDILLGNFMAGKGHPKMRLEKLSKSKSINYKDYTEKLSVIHSNNYDYIDTGDYVNSRSIITAVCKEHGEFKIRAIDHYSGNGCQKCGRISIQNKNKENPTGWSYSNWESAANRSSRFDSYKVYFLECWDPDTLEKFYKIGRTFLSIKDRFVGKHNLPYKFNILYYIELPNARDICILENKYKTIHKDLKYTPTKKFCGVNECYTNIIYI